MGQITKTEFLQKLRNREIKKLVKIYTLTKRFMEYRLDTKKSIFYKPFGVIMEREVLCYSRFFATF